MNSPSLHRQLVNRLLIPALLLWVFGGIVTYIITVRYVSRAVDMSLYELTLSLAGLVHIVGDDVSVDLPYAAKRMLEIDPYDKIYYKVSGGKKGFILGTGDLSPPRASPPRSDMPIYQDGIINGEKIRIASLYLPISGKNEWVLVQVAETYVKRRVLANEILAGVVLPQLFLITLAALLLWFGIRRGLSSLGKIQSEVSSRSHLDLSPLDPQNAPSEIGSLIRSINDLMQRLGATIFTQKRFIADAAHQLRTPLAGLKTQTDLALRQTDPAERQHSLQQMQTSSEQIIHLVNQLLSLARAEPGWEKSIGKNDIDLVSVASKTASAWVPMALKKNIDLGFETSVDSAFFHGAELLLREMLNNLIDNAIRYTQHGGKVTVRTEQRDNHYCLIVEDNGPGIPEAEEEQVFERFHRVLGSRQDGCGLGLAIAREIAHAHNGEVYLRHQPIGACFEVLLLTDKPVNQEK